MDFPRLTSSDGPPSSIASGDRDPPPAAPRSSPGPAATRGGPVAMLPERPRARADGKRPRAASLRGRDAWPAAEDDMRPLMHNLRTAHNELEALRLSMNRTLPLDTEPLPTPASLLGLPQKTLEHVLSFLDIPSRIELMAAGRAAHWRTTESLARAMSKVIGSPDVGPPGEAAQRGAERLSERSKFRHYIGRVHWGLARLSRLPGNLPVRVPERIDLAPWEGEFAQTRSLALMSLIDSLLPRNVYAQHDLMLYRAREVESIRTVVSMFANSLIDIEQPEERMAPLAGLIVLAMHVDATINSTDIPEDSVVTQLLPTIDKVTSGRPDDRARLRAFAECRSTSMQPLDVGVTAWLELPQGGELATMAPWKLRLLDVPSPYMSLVWNVANASSVLRQVHRVATAAKPEVLEAFLDADVGRVSRLLLLGVACANSATNGLDATAHKGRIMDIVERVRPSEAFLGRVARCCRPGFIGRGITWHLEPARRAVRWMIERGDRLPPAAWQHFFKAFVAATPGSSRSLHAVEAREALDIHLMLAEHMPPGAARAVMDQDASVALPRGGPDTLRCRRILGDLLVWSSADVRDGFRARLEALDAFASQPAAS